MSFRSNQEHWSERESDVLFVHLCYVMLSMYISVFMFNKKKERKSFLDSIGTEGCVQFPLLDCWTHNNVTYQISLFLLHAFSYCANIFKGVHFINVFWNGGAPLPDLKCSEKEITVLLVAFAFYSERQRECFSSWGNWRDIKNSKCFGRALREITSMLYEGEHRGGREKVLMWL